MRKVGDTEAYYMYNGHGDVTNLLDGTGKIIGSYYYDAFGKVEEFTSDISNPYKYAGYQYDEEIGKYYLKSRMYDPETARFMQEDTYRGDKNDPLSLNLYTYCENNPLIYDDQNGHWPSFIDNAVSWVKNKINYVGNKIKEAVTWAWNTVTNYVSSTWDSAKNYVSSTWNSTKNTIKKAAPIVESVKKGISLTAENIANWGKSIDIPQLFLGGLSVVAGAGAILTGAATMVIPGGQLFGAALIGAGIGSLSYGASEVIDSVSGKNPLKTLATDILGMSESDYHLLGGMATTASTFGAASAVMFAGSQASASAAGVGRVPIKSFGSSKNTQSIKQTETQKSFNAALASRNVGGAAKAELPGRNGALNQAKRDVGIPTTKNPSKVEYEYMRSGQHEGGHIIKDANGRPIKTREYYYTKNNGETVIIQEHSAGHTKGDQGPHFNVRPIDNPRTGSVIGTQDHYPFKK